MSKFIKHEFRATSRMVLPILLICVVSAFLEALLTRLVNVPNMVYVIVSMVFVVSLMTIGIIGLVVIISRFYRNTMSNDAYLTMTLPVTEHEFIWGELITNILWVLIVTIVLGVTAVVTMQLAGFINFFEVEFNDYVSGIRLFNEELLEHGVSWFSLISMGIQLLLGAILSFIAFCLHIYLSMAIGQLFNKHRVFMSILAYIAIRVAILFVLGVVVNLSGGNLEFSADTLERGADAVNLFLGLGNIVLCVGTAILYFPTALIIGKKLNLT